MRKAIAALVSQLVLLPLLACHTPQNGTTDVNPQLAAGEASLPGMEKLSWQMTQGDIAQHQTLRTIPGWRGRTLPDIEIEGCSFDRIPIFQEGGSAKLNGMILNHFSSGQQFVDCQSRVTTKFKTLLGAHSISDSPQFFTWRGRTTWISLNTSCMPTVKSFSCLQIEYEDRNSPWNLVEEVTTR